MKKLFLFLAFTMITKFSFGMCYYSCDAHHHAWIIDTHGSSNFWAWEYTSLGMCGTMEVFPVNCFVTPNPGPNGTEDGFGHVANQDITDMIAANFTFQLSQEMPDNILEIADKINNGNLTPAYVDGTKFSQAVRDYFMQNNPPNYPPQN